MFTFKFKFFLIISYFSFLKNMVLRLYTYHMLLNLPFLQTLAKTLFETPFSLSALSILHFHLSSYSVVLALHLIQASDSLINWSGCCYHIALLIQLAQKCTWIFLQRPPLGHTMFYSCFWILSCTNQGSLCWI